MKLKRILAMTLEELALNAELESTDLEPGKRMKIEARLKKLLDIKNKLIDDNQPDGDENRRGHRQYQH